MEVESTQENDVPKQTLGPIVLFNALVTVKTGAGWEIVLACPGSWVGLVWFVKNTSGISNDHVASVNLWPPGELYILPSEKHYLAFDDAETILLILATNLEREAS